MADLQILQMAAVVTQEMFDSLTGGGHIKNGGCTKKRNKKQLEAMY